jgi:Fur family zinc uptake transcriptional regulator
MTFNDRGRSGARGLQGAALRKALADAKACCETAGERLTPVRRRVLELLLAAGRPAKAYDLMSAFGGLRAPPAKPTTVYRALDFLTDLGLAHRITSLNAYIACQVKGPRHPVAFLICEGCGAAREIERLPVEWLKGAAEEVSYDLHSFIVEAHGRCAACLAGALDAEGGC